MDAQTQKDLLQGKVILITGSGDGIGRQAALSFASHGATIILLGRTISKLEKTYDDIVDARCPMPAIYPLDLSRASPDNYQELAQSVTKEFGRLDGLLHNAAVLGQLTPIEHYDVRRWYDVMQTNFHAPFLLTQATLPLLRKAQQASIVFTNAAEGMRGRAYWGAYSSAKFALNGLMQVLADELENTSIRVNCINPGIIRTKLRAKAYPAENHEQHALPTAVMQSYLYLFSDAASDVNGQWLDAQTKRLAAAQI